MTPTEYYLDARNRLLDLGYAEEIEWQAHQCPSRVSETEFLCEAAWVIYCSGFKEEVVRRRFDYLSLCFFDWTSSIDIVDNQEKCVCAAMQGLANERKHNAIVGVAEHIASHSFENFWECVLESPQEAIQSLPYLGPVTSIHLAKNLGFAMAKPDRHLVRLRDRFGYGGVDDMCQEIAIETGHTIQVVDLVLWRYMEQREPTPRRHLYK